MSLTKFAEKVKVNVLKKKNGEKSHLLYAYFGFKICRYLGQDIFTQYVNSVFYYVKMSLIYVYYFFKSLIHCLLYNPNVY